MSDVHTQDAPERMARQRSDQPGGYIWYELMTTDPAGAKRFYDAVVSGWDMATEGVAPGVDYRMIKRSDGKMAGGVLPLTEEMQQGGARPIWIGYIHSTHVDAAAEAIQADGGQVMMEPWDQPGVGRLAMVTGPEGAPFYLMDPTPPESDPNAKSDVFSVNDAEHVRWNELLSSDPDRSIAFFKRHFGWDQEREMDMGPMGKYQFFQHDGIGIGAVMKTPPNVPHSIWNHYVGVADIGRAAKAIADNGGQILHGPMEIPGGEYSLNGIDPQGATFGLVGPRKS